jgi:amidase
MIIGLDMTYVGQDNDTETIAVIEAAAAVFAAIGAELVPVKVPDVTDVANAQMAYCQVESATFHKEAYLRAPDDFGHHLGKAVADGIAYDPVRYAKHQIDRDIFKGRLRLMFEEVDAILAPVMPGVGVKYADMDAFMANIPKLLRYTCPFNMSGSPTVTMPGGFSSLDLPIGFQLVGPHLSEDRLLAASHAFQQATDWHLKRRIG